MTTYDAAIPTAAAAASTSSDEGIRGAFLTEFIDMFDIYFVVVLMPVLAYFQPTTLSPARSNSRSVCLHHHIARTPCWRAHLRQVADASGRRTPSIISVLFGLFCC